MVAQAELQTRYEDYNDPQTKGHISSSWVIFSVETIDMTLVQRQV